ncbi:ftsH, partial [Symbiodinium microadriaticum]
LIPSFLIVGILLWTMRGMGGSGGGPMGNIFKVGKSNAKMVKKEDMKVTFK